MIKGLVLTREAVMERGRLSLQYYIKTHTGVVKACIQRSHVVCFCEQRHLAQLQKINIHFTVKALSLKSFNLQPVAAIYLKSSQSLRMLVKEANDLGIKLFETDIKPEHRYLIERFIALEIEMKGDWSVINANQFDVIQARKPVTDLVVENYALKTVSLDFECSFDSELYSVGLYGHNVNLVIMVGNNTTKTSLDDECKVIWVANEVDLIHCLISWFNDYDPDIIIGWAVVVFDLALLSKRCELHNIALNIGRNHELMSWKVEGKYRPETLNLPGRVVLDGIDWLKAAFYQFDSYSLEFVSQQLLGKGKKIDHVDNRAGEITRLFEQDKLSLAQYNINDCKLVWDIFEKTKLLAFALERSKLTGLELGRVGASVAAFNHLYLPHLHRHGFVAPAEPASQGIESPGGYVMNSIPGYFQNVLVLDFKSLYPSIIRTFLIDPKGLVEGSQLTANNEQCVEGFLDAQFSRQSPILPEIIAQLATKREYAKTENNAPLSQAIKIIMNSLYGVLGSTGCVFHDAKLASSITMRGHQIMKLTKQWIEEQGYTVIYGDTDSTFVWIEQPLSANEINNIGKQLAQRITLQWQQWCNKQHNVTSFLELEFETHFTQFIMPTLRGSQEGSKKRYVGEVISKQGSKGLIFKGMEQVRSDWTPLAKRVQLEIYTRFFNKQDVITYLIEEVEALRQGRNQHEIIFKKRLRRDAEQYTAKSSPHVKAALILSEKKDDLKYSRKGQQVSYLMTLRGAFPYELSPTDIDVNYYIEKQLKPIAEPILALMGKRFENIISNQLSLI
ncbi:DNA polymerase II [Shewanella intestini]|uniref:DNA polymerase n=1 Tax=Shewanella intestini TaxID=2017544 RepID=A0ABS5I6A8_9GAMM|nr:MULTISPECIES: DNA polymerase II [Shewanella]MBR9729559.1 DNA polymerase II [Shewanella intestini]MRG35445.1 DNA polymerase II [Shewanella sp. XMDDZSB0408]